ncbi:MAG: transporter substrate-binding domain-containing protein [Anaerolineales bacterium]|nr:transporter substrate-binding domain-containing protein [Anaerolineales bacterium]
MSKLGLTRNQVLILIIVGMVISSLIAAGAYMVFSLARAPLPALPAPPTKTMALPEKASFTPTISPSDTPTPAPSDDTWARVQQAGKLVVGTSADYPPFEYYDSAFQLDGFDIALVDEIGARLGLQVEVKDLAFDGLFAALALGQVDVAAAAIAVTPGRERLAYFSDVYLDSQDGVLARQDSVIRAINSPKELAPLKVAVQRQSIYEGWIKTELVDTGAMPLENLRAYTQIDAAITDLKNGSVDLVVMDLLPAQGFLAQGDLKIVGQGISQQKYAIALRYGAGTLQAEINRILAQMVADGRLNELVRTELGVDPLQMPPLPTPRPTALAQPTPTPSGECLDGMEFIQDLSYPAFDMSSPPLLPPGVFLRKGWRVRNIGTCTWNRSYALHYVGGNSPVSGMGGESGRLAGRIPPGQEVDIYVDLVSPIFPAVYQGFWQLHNAKDIPFGERLGVGVTVLTLNPATPTSQPGAPAIQRFRVFPNDQINLGACAHLEWVATGEVADIQISRNGKVLQAGAPLMGEFRDCPPNAGEMVYRIKAIGPMGMVTATDDVWVSEKIEPTLPAQITPTPTLPPPPSIDSFVIDPPSVGLGQCFNLEWDVSGEADLIQIRRDEDIILDNAPDRGVGQDCPKGAGVYTYRIDVSNREGQSVFEQREVEVAPSLIALGTPAWQWIWRFLLYSIGQIAY